MSKESIPDFEIGAQLVPQLRHDPCRNWKIIFRFENGNAYDVNFEDYH